MLQTLTIEGYRSCRELELELANVTVLVGPNGSGKSNVYRALALLRAAATGRFARAVAAEGGMPSVLWAGPHARKEPRRLMVRCAFDDFVYHLTCGLPKSVGTRFQFDPEIKEEKLGLPIAGRKTPLWLLDRQAGMAMVSDEDGHPHPVSPLDPSESVLSQLKDPRRFAELAYLGQTFQSWRFYRPFRVDENSPLRRAAVSVRTPVLRDDGADLAAALATIAQDGDGQLLGEVLERAFPDLMRWSIHGDDRLTIQWVSRVGDEPSPVDVPFGSRDLSDGTLRFLALAAALLSIHPPNLLCLDEPETSLYGGLVGGLADLIAHAAEGTQIILTTHSQDLATAIRERTDSRIIHLEKVMGETVAC